MNRQIIIIIIGIFFISCASATTEIVAGDSYSFELSEQYSYYEITKNITEIDLNVTQNQTWVTITPNKYMKDGSFTITFYNQKDETIYSFGGGSSRRSSGGCLTSWVCNDWTECIDEEQTRDCKKVISYCYAKNKPFESRECVIPDDPEEEPEEPINLDNDVSNNQNLIKSFIISLLIFLSFIVIVKIKEKNQFSLLSPNDRKSLKIKKQ